MFDEFVDAPLGRDIGASPGLQPAHDLGSRFVDPECDETHAAGEGRRAAATQALSIGERRIDEHDGLAASLDQARDVLAGTRPARRFQKRMAVEKLSEEIGRISVRRRENDIHIGSCVRDIRRASDGLRQTGLDQKCPRDQRTARTASRYRRDHTLETAEAHCSARWRRYYDVIRNGN